MMRAFGVSSNASHSSFAATSFDTSRCRKSSASAPDTRTYARGRNATLGIATSVGRNGGPTASPADCCFGVTWSRRLSLFRGKAEQKLLERGLDPARLPPGQYLTEKWPVLHAGTVPQTDLATWDFKVFGEVDEPLTLTYDELQALPQTEITIDIHCVTRWSRFDTSFKGVHWRDLAQLVRPKPSARFVLAHAEQGFTSNVPIEALQDEYALIAWEADGEPLEPEHGWPLRLVVPSRYFWKSAKWLRGLELLSADEPGFWERYGYHNDADYWKEQRYSF
jgi:DMSO/TMAO reductase YedYZ molybdopterin-dependent catalytic subunit